MKNIYDFESAVPPMINEKLLQAELEKRRLRRQAAAIAVAGLLLHLCVLLLAALLRTQHPTIALALIIYVCVSIAGTGIITLILSNERWSEKWRPAQNL